MQAAADAQSEAWRGAEEALMQRITDAEARAAAAAERERLATDRLQVGPIACGVNDVILLWSVLPRGTWMCWGWTSILAWCALQQLCRGTPAQEQVGTRLLT